MPVDMAVPNIDNAVKAGDITSGHPGGDVVKAVGAVIWVGGVVAIGRDIVATKVDVRSGNHRAFKHRQGPPRYAVEARVGRRAEKDCASDGGIAISRDRRPALQ